MKQFILIGIASVLFTVSSYHFFLYFYVKKNGKRDLYFAISTFGGALFSFFAFLMSSGKSPEAILWLHRIRMLGLMICICAWGYCLYDIYFKKSLVPKIYLIFSILIALSLPTKIFLSLPVVEYTASFFSVEFHYCYATTRIMYSVYALSILVFFIYSLLHVAFCKKPSISRIYGLMAFIPGVIGGINDFAVTHGFIKNILISEYLVFGFLLSIFILFLKKEKEDYNTLKHLNLKLEEEVQQRTKDLKNSLEKVRVLSGMLPICSRCKKIRDDKGYWNQIEAYIRDHSEAEFTHSLCPDCAKEIFPGFEDE
ncbi:hypothetical protein JXA84_06795 [candidate division WOR-3 bacterium]|nr:hypothetical protein [candidate division WOR-3 bacterium]